MGDKITMTDDIDCTVVNELEESYLLGLLNETEMKQIKLHLSNCGSCRQRLTSYEELLGQLFSVIQPTPPHIQVRTALMTQIAKEQANSTVKVQVQVTDKTKSPNNKTTGRGWSIFPIQKNGWLVFNGLAAICLLVAVSWVVLINSQLQTQNQKMQQTLDLASSPESRVWTMLPTENLAYVAAKGPIPSAKMYVRPGSSLYLVTANHMPPLDTSQVYRVWYKQDGTTEFGANLNLDVNGNAWLQLNEATLKPTHIDTCFITVESASQPPSTPVIPPFLMWQTS
jgi:hypothetical protein